MDSFFFDNLSGFKKSVKMTFKSNSTDFFHADDVYIGKSVKNKKDYYGAFICIPKSNYGLLLLLNDKKVSAYEVFKAGREFRVVKEIKWNSNKDLIKYFKNIK